MNLTNLFRASALEHNSSPALWVDGCVISYGELGSAATRIAYAIGAARDYRIGGQCALFVDRSRTAYTSVLGALMAGLAYVPLNPRFPRDRILDMMRMSEADVIVVDDRCLAAAEAVLTACPRPLTVILPDFAAPPDWALGLRQHRFLCRPDLERVASPAAEVSPASEDGAYLLFTSGSTGLPKGVLISHANAMAYVESVRERYAPRPDDRFIQLFDFSFDLSVHDMFLCWAAGACLYSAPQNAKSMPRDFVRRHQLTFWFSVPSTAVFMSRMHVLKPGDFPSLRWSLFCGEALPMRLAREWQKAAPNSIVENLYGPTEATIAFTAYRVPQGGEAGTDGLDFVPIGWPLPGQAVAVLGSDGLPVRDGEVGELCLGGSQVAGGYWRSPDKTAERFAPPRCAPEGTRWYRTGDLAVNGPQHGLLFMGRIDRQVKIRGHRVELQEIEAVIRSEAGTDAVGVLPWPVLENGLAMGVAGFLSGRRATIAEIIEGCRRRLPEYMVPTNLHDLAEWPLNANGKTDYGALRSILERPERHAGPRRHPHREQAAPLPASGHPPSLRAPARGRHDSG